jgi:oxygen-independent coproporphyrinogen-3 oxidase
MKLTQDDKIRQHATQQLRSYFRLDFKEFERNFKINPKEYFSTEIEFLSEMIEDGLVNLSDIGIEMTELGKDFSQNISNVFDKYDPPTKSYNARLETIKKVKLTQANIQI